MNRRAFDLSMRTALALNCEIPRFTKWDRKQYYYPDLPKGYQISQYDLPMSEHGYLEISDPDGGAFESKRIRILRAHLEEDAGKSIHDDSGAADSRIDLNRTGTPLLEIVSEPDMRSPLEAKTFLSELKLLLTYLGVSDCNMQEGSLRVDANVNLHLHTPDEKVATPIIEVKNMNSFRAVERALAYEEQRQLEEWKETGQRLGQVPKQTRGWDDSAGVTLGQRSKEESSDYRYLPDPDLAPVTVTDEEVEQSRAELGELPAALRQRLVEQYDIPLYDSDVMVNQGRALVDYFITLTDESGDAKQASNWMQQSVLRALNERQVGIEEFGVTASELAKLLKRVSGGEFNTSRGRDVLDAMLESGKSVADAIASLGIEQVDEGALETLCQELLDANPNVVSDLKEGKMKAVGALIGQAKKKNANADPGKVREICLRLVQAM